ncbi:hypothetical protein GIB67_037265 [Kingdonia uniflora]|uniref:EGF-like domain-containing protein n=1 Tax=Kingdonia uniflora TaxID=39325 RepID=A0A7J7MSB4_9MAGN|nr:hypothetical protein GIB67_037265 [Kingdonia uniflora]
MAGAYQTLTLCFMLLFFFLASPVCCSASNTFTVSSFRYSKTKLDPYNWRYIRVEMPSWFSALYINLESDVGITKESIGNLTETTLPMICFRNGSPPLPDVSSVSLRDLVLSPLLNSSVGGIQDLPRVEQCHLLQKKIMLALTNEQISPGVWYVGLFNGIGSARTQSKMINRGSTFSFSANVSVDGCTTSTMWGPFCNQTVLPLSCAQSDVKNSHIRNLPDVVKFNQTLENIITCRNYIETSCQNHSEEQIYLLDVAGSAQLLKIMLKTPANETGNAGINLYTRHGAIPSSTLHDYYTDISTAPLVINSPKVGRWYFVTGLSNQTNVSGVIQEQNICYSLDWEVHECPAGKAGPNCTWESYMLQTFLRNDQSAAFESYYLPITEKISLESASFLLNPLLSNFSLGNKSDTSWTYFLLDIPRGAAGINIHIQLNSDAKLNYGIYSRFGGLPSRDFWDYYYENSTSSSNDSLFFKLDDSSEKSISFYILYAKEGTWGFGLRHPVPTGSPSKSGTKMFVATERCHRGCSGHGSCKYAVDASGLTSYSYCWCDRNHGGFDCSIEIVSHKGHIWQSAALIASNAAAILPAFWALRQKAFAEWVLFTASGISSGLYHACDVGTWCALSFQTLQFMDFWLSFMAVVSTFIYLATVDEATKRVIHTTVSILTALMAISGATRSSNIVLVIAIGTSGLLICWMIEFSSSLKSVSCSTQISLNVHERWQKIRKLFSNLIKTIRDFFRWGFVVAGFIALSMAAISWNMESSKNYWISHSLWHISIYTSSFFFLCSKRKAVNGDRQEVPHTPYELTRQDSLPRDSVQLLIKSDWKNKFPRTFKRTPNLWRVAVLPSATLFSEKFVEVQGGTWDDSDDQNNNNEDHPQVVENGQYYAYPAFLNCNNDNSDIFKLENSIENQSDHENNEFEDLNLEDLYALTFVKCMILEKEVHDAKEKMKSTLDELHKAKLDLVLSQQKLENFCNRAKNIDKMLCMGKRILAHSGLGYEEHLSNAKTPQVTKFVKAIATISFPKHNVISFICNQAKRFSYSQIYYCEICGRKGHIASYC